MALQPLASQRSIPTRAAFKTLPVEPLLRYSTTDEDNHAANGFSAISSNSTGSNNAAIGTNAPFYNTTSNYNTSCALYSNTFFKSLAAPHQPAREKSH